MNYRKMMQTLFLGLVALGLSTVPANACKVNIVVACPPPAGATAANVEICVDGVGCVTTDASGEASIFVPSPGLYTFRVIKSSLPPGANVSPPVQKLNVVYDFNDLNLVTFEIDNWAECDTSLPGPCWMTGGGTIYRDNKTPEFTFGGVVYPGCSPLAADGGNWNVVAHLAGLHFQGQKIIVDSCSGEATKSPKVNVNIIDFHGTGVLGGIGGNSTGTVAVNFVGRAVDNLEPGGGNDLLFLQVVSDSTSALLLQIGAGPALQDMALISTGNIQIHTSSCSK